MSTSGTSTSNRDRVLAAIRHASTPVDDDELSRRKGGRPRQTVNQVCRTLASQGLIQRVTGRDGKIVNVWGTAHASSSAAPSVPAVASGVKDEMANRVSSRSDEATVQAAIADHLVATGWTLISTANTATKEHGIDIVAERGSRRLAIEVKGYPSREYENPARAVEAKPTQPASQARQWYSHALLKALLTRDELPSVIVGIGLPDMPTYRNLVSRTRSSVDDLAIRIYWVAADGSVVEQATRPNEGAGA